MSISELFQPNSYNLYAGQVIVGKTSTDSFRKGKSNIQSITSADPTPRLVSFDTFIDQPFIYLDNLPNQCYTFIDDNNIRINKTGNYLLFAQIACGNETANSLVLFGINLQGTLITQSISITVSGSLMLPFFNGLHNYNCSIILSSIAQLNANDVLQLQYFCSANTDIYPSSFIGLKFLGS